MAYLNCSLFYSASNSTLNVCRQKKNVCVPEHINMTLSAAQVQCETGTESRGYELFSHDHTLIFFI